MKIAIHHNKDSFSERWIKYCEQNKIDYKIVNAYDNDIIQQIDGCDCFMWHFYQGDYRDMQMAKALILSLEVKGVRCFPDSSTCWYFDNKVWEKYLLEAVGAPLVPSYVFYTQKEALEWVSSATFPKVFKLKGGAGASNVKLAHTPKEAKKFIKQGFGKGFAQYRWREHFKETWRKYRLGKATIRDVLRPIKYAFRHFPTTFDHYHGREIGYVYFQDFIPDNTTDFRIKVVNGNCWGFQRKVRSGDFRASGSGELIFDNSKIPIVLVKIAQIVAKKIAVQSIAFDFVYDKGKKQYLIVEMSYGFGFDEEESHNGYWDKSLAFHPEPFNPFGWMVDNLMK